MLTSLELTALGAVSVGYAVHIFVKHRRARSGVYPLNGPMAIFDAHTAASEILPYFPGLALGRGWGRIQGHELFKKSGYDVIATFGFFPQIRAVLHLADAELIKEITTARSRFPKPVEDYVVLGFYGSNVVITEGQEWKKHRKIAAPAFGEPTNKLVWNESVLIMHGLFDKWDRESNNGRDPIFVNHGVDVTMQMTLMAISAAGFGNRLSWEDSSVPPGHKMTFKHALHIASSQLIFKVIMPEWLPSFTAGLRETRTAFAELKVYMAEMINERKVALEKQQLDGSDLLSLLYRSSEQGQASVQDVDEAEKNATQGVSSGAKLTDEEVMGNTFLFLVAGHETTSHTLCFAFAYLALYPDVQEKLYKHVMNSVHDIDNPVYSDMGKLPYALAVVQETMRHIPPVPSIPKFAGQDTTIRVHRNTEGHEGESVSVFVPAGTNLDINVTGLHYNPRYWKNPEKFDPDRFLGEWNRDAFLPFSGGPRACLGRRFAETESTVFLAMLISRYEISIQDEPQFRGETFDQKEKRVLEGQAGITTTPVRVPLVFKRRNVDKA